MNLPDPLEDESRWTILSSRFETDGLLRQMFDEMFEDWVRSLPAGSSARLLWEELRRIGLCGGVNPKLV